MKKLLFVLLMAMASVLLNAQSYTILNAAPNGAALVTLNANGSSATTNSSMNTVGTSGTVYTQTFTLGGYLNAGTTSFTYMGWSKLHTVGSGKAHNTSVLQGSYDAGFADGGNLCDTLGVVADSAATRTNGTFSYSASVIYPYYRIKTVSTAAAPATNATVYKIYAYKHD